MESRAVALVFTVDLGFRWSIAGDRGNLPLRRCYLVDSHCAVSGPARRDFVSMSPCDQVAYRARHLCSRPLAKLTLERCARECGSDLRSDGFLSRAGEQDAPRGRSSSAWSHLERKLIISLTMLRRGESQSQLLPHVFIRVETHWHY